MCAGLTVLGAWMYLYVRSLPHVRGADGAKSVSGATDWPLPPHARG